MERTLVAFLRFSSVATLYGLQQLETAVASLQGAERFSQQVQQWEATVNAATDRLAEHMSEEKRETLKSFASTAEQVVDQSFAVLGLADPRQILRLTNSLVGKSAETISNWMQKPEPEAAEEPKLAVDVLAS